MTDPAMSENADIRPPINADWLARMRSTNPEFLAKLFEVFLEDEPQRLAALGEAVAKADLEMVRYLTHSIKGAAATLGMERLRDAAREMEFAARDGQTQALEVQYARVRAEVEAVFAVMRSTK